MLALCALPLVGALLVLAPTSQGASSSPKVVLSGVYFDGYLPGSPEPEEAIRLTNTDPRQTVDVSGWKISDRFQIITRRAGGRKGGKRRWRRSRSRRSGRGSNAASRDIILPTGTKIPPHSSIWIAYQARAFRTVFGFNPHVEGKDTNGNIPTANIPNGWPNFYASQGIVSLHNAYGNTVDVVCYVRDSRSDNLDRQRVPQDQWSGPSVILKGVNAYSWTGQILARDRDEKGIPIPDTNTAKDWDNSFAKTQLKRDLTHRVERPGQSLFTPQRHHNTYAEVLATSAPENNYAALLRAFRRAKREILVNIYQFTNPRIADALVEAAKRQVRVVVLMEGAPVGGVREKSRHIAFRLFRAGATVHWMRSDRKRRIRRRYRFNHAKYVILDRKWVIIGSENYGSTGHPVHPSRGNRGWEIHVRSPKIVKELLRVFLEDTATARQRDLLTFQADGTRWGRPKAGFRPSRKIKYGHYTYRRPPLRVRGKMGLELVLSPDNSLHERQSLIGSILRCKKEVLALQNSIPLFWGKKGHRSLWTTPNLPLMALIQAARKGCRVRVMLDSTWYHIRANNPRGNDKTVRTLNRIAYKENLNLQAKLINLQATGLSKIHAKGIIVDRKETFIGSINWSENSFKGNREVGIIITHKKIARYYADLFMRDWLRSRMFQAIIAQPRSPVYTKPNVISRVMQSVYAGDPLDVLAEVGGFYQVRLHRRKIGYLRKHNHILSMSSFEARAQVGRVGIVHGRIRYIRQYGKMLKLYFEKPHERGLHLLVWRSNMRRDNKLDSLVNNIKGRYIQAKGKVSTFRRVPQMIIRRSSQLNFLD